MRRRDSIFEITTWWGDTVLDCVHRAEGAESRLRDGRLEIRARRVGTPEPLDRAVALDWEYLRTFSVTLLAHGFLTISFLITPPADPALTGDMVVRRGRIDEWWFKKESPPKEKKVEIPKRRPARGEAGRLGPKDRPQPDAAPGKPGRVDPRKREDDRAIARRSGLLGALLEGGHATTTVLGPGGLGSALDRGLGGLRGRRISEAGGAGGLGTRGTGAGGGGRSVEIGSLATSGGPGAGVDIGGPGKKRTQVVDGGVADLAGGLTKAQIARVIRRNLPRFRFCYEKNLNAAPNLAGKIAVGFTIAPTGAVAQASLRESTIGSSEVERCVLGVMRSLRFPRPRGGGIVIVRYPFVFQSL